MNELLSKQHSPITLASFLLFRYCLHPCPLSSLPVTHTPNKLFSPVVWFWSLFIIATEVNWFRQAWKMKNRDHDKENQHISIIGSVSLKMNSGNMNKKQDFKLLSLNFKIITQILRMRLVCRMFCKCTKVLVNFYKMCQHEAQHTTVLPQAFHTLSGSV